MDKQQVRAGLAVAAPLAVCAAPLLWLVPQAQGLRALAFFLFWVLLPGLCLARLVLPRQSGRLLKGLVGFFMGVAALFALFYVGRLAGTMLPLRVLPPALGLGYCVYVLAVERERPWQGLFAGVYKDWPLLWVVALGTWLSFYLLAIRFPDIGQITNVDYLWHMGNVHTLANSPDFTDIRVSVMTFRYHYFSDLVWACAMLVVGADPYQMIMRWPVFVVPALSAGAMWLCLGHCTKRRWLRVVGTVVGLFFVALYGSYNDVTYQLLTNVNAVGLALPCGLVLLAVAVEESEKPQVDWRGVVLVAMLSLLLTGFKGPFTPCVLAAGIGGPLVRRLVWQKKLPGRWLVMAGAAVLGFAIVWATLLRGGLNEDYIKSWQPFYSVYTAEVLAPLLVFFGNGLFARTVLLPLHLVIVLGPLAPLLVTATVHAVARAVRPPVKRRGTTGSGKVRFAIRAAKREALPGWGTAPLVGALASLFAYYMFDLAGRSQFYFLYFAVPMAALVGVQEAERLLATRIRPVWKRALAAMAAGMLVFSAAHPMREGGWQKWTDSEVAAAEWLAENAGEGLVATNRHGTMYLASGISGACFWLEGDAYARNSGYTVEDLEDHAWAGDRLFRADTENAYGLARQTGIIWLLQYEEEADPATHGMLAAGFELVWVGDRIRIWKVA